MATMPKNTGLYKINSVLRKKRLAVSADHRYSDLTEAITRQATKGNNMQTTYSVVINADTTGTICDDTLDGQHPIEFLGEIVRIKSHDENGNNIELEGRLTEIL